MDKTFFHQYILLEELTDGNNAFENEVWQLNKNYIENS